MATHNNKSVRLLRFALVFAGLVFAMLVVTSFTFIITRTPVYHSEIEHLYSSASDSDTTLHEAVVNGDLNQVKRLIAAGLPLDEKDSRGWTALDYARKRNRQEIRKYIVSLGARTFPKSLPGLIEGPHVLIRDSDSIEVRYLKHDAHSDKSFIESRLYSRYDLPVRAGEVLIEKSDIDRLKEESLPSAFFSGVTRVMVIGDIHGEFDRVRSLLLNNSVIDKDGGWIWGDGHLVFMGDIFDRGSKVTEALWMIYSLMKQAERDGGRVHLILGNHEPMIFKDDLRYITDEYYAICDNLGMSYSDLFGVNTLLGKWLRNLPGIIRINDYGFVHAGISSDLLSLQLEIDSINKIIWQFHNGLEEDKNKAVREKILGSNGILWYRGFINNAGNPESLEDELVNRVLGFYDLKTLIIGHTEVDSVSSFYNGMVINVNIPKRKLEIPEQGLLIVDQEFHVIYEDKTSKRIIF